jgi:branched-subunit amino acid transport protein
VETALTDLALVLVVAVLTYLSRATAVALLPPPKGHLLEFVSRIPAPLFAGLAVYAFVGSDLTLPDPPTIAAVVAALAVSPKKSLGITLAAGIIGFLVVDLMT